MSTLNELIEQVENPELNARIRTEVARLSKQKKFGLVFEEHLPECTPLYEIPVKKGATVAILKKIYCLLR
jgi:adenine-specific DNA-methyltransferase